jgi:hypothetical protein
MDTDFGREVVFDFLVRHKDKKYTANSLFVILKEERADFDFNYYQTRIMIETLIATKKIRMIRTDDFQVVWYEEVDSHDEKQ